MSKDLNHSNPSRLLKMIDRFITWLYEFFSGAALSWTSVPYLLLRRQEYESLFAFALFLNMRGLSPLPPRYRLWLLPEITPQILYWRRKLALWDDALETADLKHIGH